MYLMLNSFPQLSFTFNVVFWSHSVKDLMQGEKRQQTKLYRNEADKLGDNIKNDVS